MTIREPGLADPAGLAPSNVLEVANRLHSAAIHLLRRARIADRDSGLSPERLSLLSVLVYAGPRTLSQLAEIEQVSRPAISRSVKALTEAGLVRRERSPSDRRSVTIHPTDRGRRLMEQGRRRRLERIAVDLEKLDDKALQALARAADILAATTDQRASSAATPRASLSSRAWRR